MTVGRYIIARDRAPPWRKGRQAVVGILRPHVKRMIVALGTADWAQNRKEPSARPDVGLNVSSA